MVNRLFKEICAVTVAAATIHPNWFRKCQNQSFGRFHVRRSRVTHIIVMALALPIYMSIKTRPERCGRCKISHIRVNLCLREWWWALCHSKYEYTRLLRGIYQMTRIFVPLTPRDAIHPFSHSSFPFDARWRDAVVATTTRLTVKTNDMLNE